MGSTIVRNLEALASKNGVRGILLDSLDTAAGFWRRQGYLNTRWPNCKENVRITNLWAELVQRYGRNPLDNEEADEKFRDLIEELSLARFKGGKNQGDEGEDEEDEEDADAVIVLYPMLKCL